jgi:hypothetical protein
MPQVKCIYGEKCPFFNNVILPEIAKDILIKEYCLGEFEKCQRKRIRDAGNKPEDNLTPDGRLIARNV